MPLKRAVRKQLINEIRAKEGELNVLGKKRRLFFRTKKHLIERLGLLRKMSSSEKEGEQFLKIISDYISLFGVPDFELRYAPALHVHASITAYVAQKGKEFFEIRKGVRIFSWALAEKGREIGVVQGYRSKDGIGLVVEKRGREDQYSLNIDKRFLGISEQFLKKVKEFSELHGAYTKKYTK